MRPVLCVYQQTRRIQLAELEDMGKILCGARQKTNAPVVNGLEDVLIFQCYFGNRFWRFSEPDRFFGCNAISDLMCVMPRKSILRYSVS